MPAQTLQPAQTVKAKINYIDNLRVLLTMLVILHHTTITYGGPGDWYFRQPTTSTGALIAMTLFVATNQAFFMGFFFFLSALFTEPSYNKKGAGKFIADRLKRLGLPLLFYSFILSPVLNFIVYVYGKGNNVTFVQFLGGYDSWINFGVLWFVAALLVFTFVYAAIKRGSTSTTKPARVKKVPGNNTILLFALILGLVSYVVRIFFPVGWVLKPVGFQLAHFTQYIALFTFGIIAARNNWLANLNPKNGKRWLIVVLIMVFVVFPCFYMVKEATHSTMGSFQGNGSWQSLIVAVWEQVTGISVIMMLLCITKAKWNTSSPLLQRMARASFATYIIHPLIVISLTVLLKDWAINPAIKLLVAAPVVVTASFLSGSLLVKIPGVRDVV